MYAEDLRYAGYAVELAHDAVSFKELSRRPFAVALVDRNLWGDVKSTDVIPVIRGSNPGVDIVEYSGEEDAEIQKGVIDRNELLRRIKKNLICGDNIIEIVSELKARQESHCKLLEEHGKQLSEIGLRLSIVEGLHDMVENIQRTTGVISDAVVGMQKAQSVFISEQASFITGSAKTVGKIIKAVVVAAVTVVVVITPYASGFITAQIKPIKKETEELKALVNKLEAKFGINQKK